MDYQLEALGDEGFQKLCQALLTIVFPNVTCMPVNQPDGGRDALLLDPQRLKNTIAFQVKYSRAPQASNERDAILKLIETEGSKIKELVGRGISAYYFITNVGGTSHLDAGSIDRANSKLSAEFGIPVFCWWRDDIERRIDANSSVKWSYPEILRGVDIIQGLITGAVGESATRRSSAVRSYITTQFGNEEDLKFKQVELQNKILNLFTDVPVRILSQSTNKNSAHYAFEYIDFSNENQILEALNIPNVRPGEHSNVMASDLFILTDRMQKFSKIILEGAPGQGKSTITQYICQVNRMKLLDRSHDLSKIPEQHRRAHVRVPFRVDLRDYATWVSGKTPFGVSPNDPLPSGTSKALEAFLAAQVADASGGFEFSVADLSVVISSAHILLVLDGFDEVADVPSRRSLVDQISQGARRLGDLALSIQIIVTSRPTAFANSPGFPEKEWLHLELQSLTPRLISEYSEKWMSAKGLLSKAKVEFRGVLENRLGQGHIRDLARNPMQLAILLSLISTKGLSLPDKRTALYDSYVELFFSREAEKSEVVRDHRDLLIMLHRHVAWVIQTEAESGVGNGGIDSDRMRKIMREYLFDCGHNPALVDELFTGMVERVVALVSRVIGTYEFEVQPLREYFCGRHLYETAPYSPPGGEKSGTKPDRFLAMAKNFYWLNTVRFYAGCYSSGELSSLADGIEQLAEFAHYKDISQPRRLASTMLSDWVFMQQPHAARRVVDFIVEGETFKTFLALAASDRASSEFNLPEGCGRGTLVDAAKRLLPTAQRADVRRALARIITSHCDKADRYAYWRSIEGADISGDEWVGLIIWFRIADEIPESEWMRVFRVYGTPVLQVMMSTSRVDIMYQNAEIQDAIIEGIGADSIDVGDGLISRPDGEEVGAIEVAISGVSTFMYSPAMRAHYADLPLRDIMERMMGRQIPRQDFKVSEYAVRSILSEFSEVVTETTGKTAREWSVNLSLWSSVVEVGRSLFGESLAWLRIAILASAISSRAERATNANDILDGSAPLAARMRRARFRRGDANWWRGAIERAHSDEDKLLIAVSVFSLATEDAILRLKGRLSALLDAMSDNLYEKIYRSVELVTLAREMFGHQEQQDSNRDIDREFSNRALALLELRAVEERRRAITAAYKNVDKSADKRVRKLFIQGSLTLALAGQADWREVLALLRDGYADGLHFDSWRFERRMVAGVLPRETAEEIAASPAGYPLFLLGLADDVLTEVAGAQVVAVGAIAQEGGWF